LVVGKHDNEGKIGRNTSERNDDDDDDGGRKECASLVTGRRTDPPRRTNKAHGEDKNHNTRETYLGSGGNLVG
jgi:hypothetical protein